MSSGGSISVPGLFFDQLGWHSVQVHWSDGERRYYLDGTWVPTVLVDMELEADRYARRSPPHLPPSSLTPRHPPSRSERAASWTEQRRVDRLRSAT